MTRLKLQVKILAVIAILAVFSCTKEPVGYLEVRNLTNDIFTNVSWGEFIHLGPLAPGEEKGDETASFTSRYLYFEIGNWRYRSQTEILVDANSSATYIVHDKNQLVILE